MNILGFEIRRSPQQIEQRSTDVQTLSRLDEIIGSLSGQNFTGEKIDDKTALQIAAVMACVRTISEDTAALPMQVKRPDANGVMRPVDDHDLTRLLNTAPNEWQTGMEFREQLVMHAVLSGNGYAYIVRDGAGNIGELIPLEPSEVSVVEGKDHAPQYTLGDGQGGLVGRVDAKNMIHLRGLSYNGWSGMNPVKVAANALGLTRTLEKSQAYLHKNGGRPGGILTTDEALSPERVKGLAKSWKASVGGGNQFGTAVLDAGIKFQSLAMTGVDAQHLETRRFQIEEVCRIMRVFPVIVMQSDKASTFASAEAFFSAHLKMTVNPWCRRIEAAFDRDLLDGAGPYCVKHNTSAFTMASMKDRGEFYRTVVETGIYTRNECRAMEGLPPVDGGDEILTPMNMTTETGQEAESNAD